MKKYQWDFINSYIHDGMEFVTFLDYPKKGLRGVISILFSDDNYGMPLLLHTVVAINEKLAVKAGYIANTFNAEAYNTYSIEELIPIIKCFINTIVFLLFIKNSVKFLKLYLCSYSIFLFVHHNCM